MNGKATMRKPNDVCQACNGARIVPSCGGACPGAPTVHSASLGCLP